MDRNSVEGILDFGRFSQSVTMIDKCTKAFREHRGIVPSSYPGLVNAAVSDQTEPSDAAGVVNNPDTSDDPQHQLFVNLKKTKAVGMAKMSLSGIALLQPTWLAPKAYMANVFETRPFRKRAEVQQPITDC
jgi:hypothetical protein